MRTNLAIGLGLGLVCAGCSCNSPKDGAVRVVVIYDGFKPGCVEVVEAEAGGGQSAKVELERGSLPGNKATIAVYRNASWKQQLDLRVRSYEGACTGTPLEDIARESPMAVMPDVVGEWVVTLHAVDEDGDGFAAAAAGVMGTDCDDHAPSRHPGAEEDCAGSLDMNCDGHAGCEDPTCPGKSCDDHQACTALDVCHVDGGCAGEPVVCDAPNDQCRVSPGTCGEDGGCSYEVELSRPCDAGTGIESACRSDGTCAPGESNCADGLDNDSNGQTDCDDSACLFQACDAGDACIVGAQCNAAHACAGSQMVCDAPPGGPCWLDAGTCSAGVCVYSGAAGLACNDGNACTQVDQCSGSGTCVGASPKACSSPINTVCFDPDGGCNPQDGGCSYAVRVNAACNDSNLCTSNDKCLPSGTCQGAAYNCDPLNDCYDAGTCLGDGGCYRPVRTWQPCSGGFCRANGTCVPTGPFPYLPMNFLPSAFSPDASVVIDCAARFDSSGAGIFTTWCSGQEPVRGLPDPLSTGDQVMVIATPSLTITDAGSLTLVGNRPVVLAVYGDATIDGPIYANSVAGGRTGAGANRASCGAQTGGDGSRSGKSGGGGGAGNATVGGIGGKAGNDAGTSGAAGAPGSALPVPLRGGCKGGAGGPGDNGDQANGGKGGGAVQISAAGALTITSRVSASAAGGIGANGASNNGDPGGGGGGSAGAILLEANQLKLAPTCQLTANGGAGGGGADSSSAGDGDDGYVDSSLPAYGGLPQGGSGHGGDGGSALANATVGGSSGGHGGGGGGGAHGFIYLRHASTSVTCVSDAGVISPPPFIHLNCP